MLGPLGGLFRGLLFALALSLPIGIGDRAEAACTTDTPPLADGGSVTCAGNNSDGFDTSGAIHVTIVTSGPTGYSSIFATKPIGPQNPSTASSSAE